MHLKFHHQNHSLAQSCSYFTHDLTRREFISNTTKTIFYTSCLALGVPLYSSCSKQTEINKKSIVSLVMSNKVWINGGLDKSEVHSLLNQGILNVTGYKNVTKAWKSLFSPSDIVAIKINSIDKYTGFNKPELSFAVAECLNKYVNIPFESIILYDRFDFELIRSGYSINQSNKGIKVIPTHAYSFSSPMKKGDIKTPLTSILTKTCTALVNLSLLKTHVGSKISLSFKNHYGSIPKEIVQDDTLGYHARNFRNLIYLNSLSPIRDKTRLCIVDSLKGQYKDGPQGNPNYQWKYNGLIMGIDPVAVDTIGLNIINEKREEKSLPPFKVKYLKWAEEEGLGICDRECIDLKQTLI